MPAHVSGFPKATAPSAARRVSAASTVAGVDSPLSRPLAADITSDFTTDEGFSFSHDDSFFSQIDESELVAVDVKSEPYVNHK